MSENQIFFNTVKNDLFRYSKDHSLKSFLKHLWYTPGFKFTVALRLIKQYPKTHLLGITGRFLYKYYSSKYCFQIPMTTLIGEALHIQHFGHIIINSQSVIGNNCTLYPGITVGATFRGKNQGTPSIGNNVWLGTNSVIVGGIIIGNNVLIAPNSFVNVDIPANSIVFGNPAIIKSSQNATQDYILNPVDFL